VIYKFHAMSPNKNILSANQLFSLIDMKRKFMNREYYMALSVSHPVSTRDTNIIPRAKMKGNCFIDIGGIYDYHCLSYT
jgi:hypothetical protein